MTTFEAGQRWSYAAPADNAGSRIIIGAILEFAGGRRIAGCTVTGALQKASDGTVDHVTIPFLPMTLEALAETVLTLDGTGQLPDNFAAELDAWQHDARGATYFTVPFEGSLERMIARQMAAIIEQS